MGQVSIDIAFIGDTELVAAPGLGKAVECLAAGVNGQGGVNNGQFNDGVDDIGGLIELRNTTTFELPHNADGWFTAGENRPLNLNLSAVTQVSGFLTFRLRDA